MSDALLKELIEEVRNVRAVLLEQGGVSRIVEPPEFFTREEAANLLHCSLPTLDKLRAQGRLPWAKPGQEVLLRRSDVERYLREEFQASVR